MTNPRPWHVVLAMGMLAAAAHAGESATDRLVYRQPVADGSIGKLDLAALTGECIDALLRMHVETDPQDPQFGLIYETYDPVKKIWVEAEGRDTMHHHMWTMVSLANAYRAEANPKVVEFLKRYPYAFYLGMMLNGEQHFGPEYGNGFCPYYWDNGSSYDLRAYLMGKKLGPQDRVTGFSEMSSMHLAQDLSLGHLDLWWLSADPRLKQVAVDLYQQVHYGKIAERFAARNYAITELKASPAKDLAKFQEALVTAKEWVTKLSENERRALYEKQFPPRYAPIVTAARHVVGGDAQATIPQLREPETTENYAWRLLRERKPGVLPAFTDDQAFDYYLALARFGYPAGITENYARWFTMWFLTRALLNEYWMDDAPYRHGYAHFPGFSNSWAMKDGRFVTYHSQVTRHHWHTRGLQFTWMTAIALQMMERWPDMHEHLRKGTAPNDPVVRFTDRTPPLAGRRDERFTTVLDDPQVQVSLASDPRSLFVLIDRRVKDQEVTLTVYDTDKEGQQFALIRVSKDGEVQVQNADKKALQFWSADGPDGIQVQVPYGIHRPQNDWFTAVEHGRYLLDLRVGQAAGKTQVVYFLSDPQRIKTRLQDAVEGGIVNHAAMLRKDGWLSYAPPDKSRSEFTNLSFSGAYGHLIHSIAQYQMWQKHRFDWEVKREVKANLHSK